MKNILIAILSLLASTSKGQDSVIQPAPSVAGLPSSSGGIIQLVLVSDIHYGITRKHFRHADSVASTVVNKAMIAAINRLPMEALPDDSGMAAGERVGAIDALLVTGDIANREEKNIQPAAASWAQFLDDYAGLTTKGRNGQPSEIWLTPGNHDVSNALGYCRPLEPAQDASAMAGIYNRMLHPAHNKTKDDYNYTTDKIHYSKDISGSLSPSGSSGSSPNIDSHSPSGSGSSVSIPNIDPSGSGSSGNFSNISPHSPSSSSSPSGSIHLLFVNLWPDSFERRWIEQDLSTVPPGTPVLLFTHSMPDVESRFFTNPNGEHTINRNDNFENLLAEQFKDGTRFDEPALIEQRQLDTFLKTHPSIRAWFHGHSNYNEFYDWPGPDNDLDLHCFRVDSPMKGKFSSKDETLLSFQLITIDMRTKTMTVRECRWNTSPDQPGLLQWGQHRTISLTQ